MSEPKYETLAVEVEAKRRFVRICFERGIKIYVAAGQALQEWIDKQEKKPTKPK
jgi:hypothetical protein